MTECYQKSSINFFYQYRRSGNALFELAQEKLQTKGLRSKDISPHDKSGCLIVFLAINVGLHYISGVTRGCGL